MSKQDRQGVRTAQDIERKYNFSSMQKAIEMSAEGLFKTNATLDNFVSAVVRNFSEMRSELDSVAEVWFYSGVPTLENEPAITWDDQQEHIGDLYYDEETGFAYRFTPNGWAKVTDSDTVYALALANTARDTQDNSRRVFIEKPTPPYSIGDIWLDDDMLYICQIEKAENEVFESVDFIHYSKYIEDAVVVHGDEIRENTNKIEDVETIAKQTAGKFEWIVKSGDSETNFILTDRMAYLFAESLVIKDESGESTIISGGKLKNKAITSEQIDVNDLFAQDIVATGTIYGATLIGEKISLGENKENTVIELCGGTGKIYAASSSEEEWLADVLGIYGQSVSIKGESAMMHSFIPVPDATDDDDYTQYVHGGFYTYSSVEDTQTAYCQSSMNAFCNINWSYARIELNADTVQDARLEMEVSGSDYWGMLSLNNKGCVIDAPLLVNQGVHVATYDADYNEVTYELLRLGGSETEPICILGDSLYVNQIGRTNICGGKQVTLLTANTRVSLATNTNGIHIFYPQTTNSVYLGGASNKWAAVYSATSAIQTSDAREKENIIPLGASPIMMLSLDDEATQYDIHSELFDRLIPVQYNYINGNGRICYGLVAQQVAEVMDELGIGEDELDLVHHDYWKDEETGEEKDSYGLAYANLIAMLIHEVQKLKTEVATLKAS